jgi:hypothetical protein
MKNVQVVRTKMNNNQRIACFPWAARSGDWSAAPFMIRTCRKQHVARGRCDSERGIGSPAPAPAPAMTRPAGLSDR